MRRKTGVCAHGIRMPVVRKGDKLASLVAEYLELASKSSYEPFELRDRDVVGVTESLLARAQGNIVTLDEIALDVSRKLPEGDAAVAFPILSRNRFLQLLDGIVRGVRGKVLLFLSCPGDEVGNHLADPVEYLKKSAELPPCFGEAEYDAILGRFRHPFTGVDYVELYKSLNPDKIELYFTNNPLCILDHVQNVILANIHQRGLYASLLRERGAKVLTLDQICTAPLSEGGGYNAEYGLLGSNYSRSGAVKLFPRDAREFAYELQAELRRVSGREMQTLVYGDGAFKDPACGIWELADPVVSPGYTEGLEGTPSEIKLKMVADNAQDNPDEAVRAAILAKPEATKKESGLSEQQNALGTTPRRYSDLLGSLCDLVSGSGDKGTPVVHISGYFDSFIDD
ncbi:MAG: F420-0--gamma-glutamyl ligase [Fretibacterium sp.]|nr:F420-0--gamma-glutamyl ligase [Fretibacterium sp.]